MHRLLPVLVLACPVLWQGVARAENEPGPATAPRPNRPPKIKKDLRADPHISSLVNLNPGQVTLRSERTVRLFALAEDPDDDALRYSVRGLPPGATFDPDLGRITWRPTRADEGTHPIAIEVTDGKAVADETFELIVRPNQAPVGASEQILLRAAQPASREPVPVGEGAGSELFARDPDNDSLGFRALRLPRGARLTPTREALVLSWSPTDADVGEHEIVVDVTDGELSTRVRRRAVVMPSWSASSHSGWFLLGGGATGFIAQGDGEPFVGGAFDATLATVRENGREAYLCENGLQVSGCHASHHRFYAEFEVLDSTRARAPALFTYAIGYSASLQWNPQRRYLIPHYGVEVGGLFRDGLGHRAQTRPYLGLHLWASDRIWVNLDLGYRVTPAELSRLSGPTSSLRAVLTAW